MLLGEYIYGGHWPLDFGILRAMIIQRLTYAVQRFIIALILTFFFVKINKSWVGITAELNGLYYCIAFVCIDPTALTVARCNRHKVQF